MAGNRSLSNDVLFNDNFVKLPGLSKILYMYINNATDDKGFCDTMTSVMLTAGAKPQHLKALIDARYIIQITDWLYLEKHFFLNNKGLRKERLRSRYDEYLTGFELKDNGSYTVADKCLTNDGQMTDNCTKNVNITKPNLTKPNLTKHNKEIKNKEIDELAEFKRQLRGQ